MNSASTISHLTAGTRQPYSTEAAATFLISASGGPPFAGLKPMSCMSRNATANISDQDGPAQHERDAEAGRAGR